MLLVKISDVCLALRRPFERDGAHDDPPRGEAAVDHRGEDDVDDAFVSCLGLQKFVDVRADHGSCSGASCFVYTVVLRDLLRPEVLLPEAPGQERHAGRVGAEARERGFY